MKLYLIIFSLFILFGSIMFSIDTKVDTYFESKGFSPEKIDLSLRDKISQNSFLAALGGYRSLLASLMSLKGITEWEKTNWAGIDSVFQIVTSLQPNVIFYWRDAKRFLGDDAASYYKNVSKESELIRHHLRKVYIDKALKYLNDGIKNTKPNYSLHMEKALLYDIRLQDYANSSKSFQKASEIPNAPNYLKRRAVYDLLKVPGKMKESYSRFKKLFLESEIHHMPSLLLEGYRLEIFLGIKQENRVFSYDLIPRDLQQEIPPPFFDLKKIVDRNLVK